MNTEAIGQAFDRDSFLRIHGQDASAWAQRYGLEPLRHPCLRCGVILETTIPFAAGEIRGLIAPYCECGNTLVPYCAVRDPKWGDLLDGGWG